MSYVLPKTNKQISTLLKLRHVGGVYYRLCQLIAKFIRKPNYYEFLYFLFKRRDQSDTDFFRQILPYIKVYHSSPHYMSNLAKSHIEKIEYLTKSPLRVKNYLDFGCGKCDLTPHVGAALGLKKQNIYGTDIKAEFEADWAQSRPHDQITFEYSQPTNIIPHSAKFDLITAFMVLHHVPETAILATIEAIFQALSPAGIFLIKEHDCVSPEDRIFADLTHSLFILQNGLDKKKIFEQEINYKSAAEWSRLICRVGFQDITQEICSAGSLSKNYVAVFRRPSRAGPK